MATQTNTSMVSEVSICNQALTWLGQKPIVSLDQSSTTAIWMVNNYPFIRDAVLEAGMWTFATIRAKSVTANRDEWDIAYKHAAPLGWLSVRRVYDAPYVTIDGQAQATWSLEDGYILSECDTIYIYGLQRITDTAKFSSLFVQAFAARLAADACIPLTANRQLQVDMWALYETKLSEALAMDGKQGLNERMRARVLDRVR